MAHLIGLDVGTTGAKALLINEEGAVVASAVSEYPLYTPRPLWSEQNPEDWWEAAAKSIRGVLEKAGVPGDSVCGGYSVTSMRR